jgi:chromosome segregation ATPase
MTETVETPEQPQPPAQQEQTPSPSQGENWEARYKGLVSKVEQLVIANKDLTTQLAEARSQIERLNADLGLRETEKTVAVSERDRQIQDLVSKSSEAEKELAALKALQLKVQVATELGKPELLSLAQHIPNLTDKEALTTVMADFAKWGEAAVKQREQQLLAGMPFAGGVTPPSTSAPQSDAEWKAKIEKSNDPRERQDLFDGYYAWLQAQHTRR